MKRTGITFMAILFIFALFAGQALADQQTGFQTQDQQMRGTTGVQAQSQEINRASEITGYTVRNHQGEELGEVNDLVFDNQGNISYLILSKGGLMGVGADLVPIPWKAENITIQEDSIILSMDQQRLDQAPSFSSGEWENLEDQSFQQRVHGYYGVEQQQRLQDRPHQEGISPDPQRSPDTPRQPGFTPDTPRFPDRQGQPGYEGYDKQQ
jgi:sporulation protein YlmC with PRC-barrel domain